MPIIRRPRRRKPLRVAQGGALTHGLVPVDRARSSREETSWASGRLKIRPRARPGPRSGERDGAAGREANRFFDQHGRVPSRGSADHEEMRLGIHLESWPGKADEELAELDRERGSCQRGGVRSAACAGPPKNVTGGRVRTMMRSRPLRTTSSTMMSWRSRNAFHDDQSCDPGGGPAGPGITGQSSTPVYDFDRFPKMFERAQAALEAGEREVRPINHNEGGPGR